MKIHDMTKKTLLEIEDTDLLVIEDNDDTKAFTVQTLKELIILASDRHIKELINETLNKAIAGMEAAKYKFETLIEKKYRLNIWIGSDSGNIQASIFSPEANQWLTADDINELFGLVDVDGNPVAPSEPIMTLMFGGLAYEPSDIKVLKFNEEHGEHPEEVNPWLSADDAGFLKAHFDGFTHNEISEIIYEDVRVQKSEEYNEETDTRITYEFISTRDSFANAVRYTLNIPMQCCCSNMSVMVPDGTIVNPNQPDDEEDES